MKPADIARKVNGYLERGANAFIFTRSATLHVDRIVRTESGRFALYYKGVQYGTVDPEAVTAVEEGGRLL